MRCGLAWLHLDVSLFMKLINRTMWGSPSQLKDYHNVHIYKRKVDAFVGEATGRITITHYISSVNS
jgi:hypothetical protein